jgi:predicted HTH transcriptional regulator
VVHGPLFDQIDAALDFVMARLARPVGTREESARLESGFEIPRPAAAEAIINAVAHRDYASGSAVHVRVFADRIEVASPGQLPRSLTPEQLTRAHPSIPGNPLIAEVLFLAGYVERAGTGTIDILNQCRAAGLPDPDFFQDGDQWIVRLWRDRLNEGLLTGLGLNNRQIAAMLASKAAGYITTQRYIEVAGTSRPTAKRDLEELVALELLRPEGSGRAARYRIRRNRLKNGSIGSSPERDANGS